MRVRDSLPSDLPRVRRAPGLGRDGRSPALAFVEPPPALKRVAMGVALAVVLLAVALLAVPWRQSAIGTGRVIAYAPADRQQVIQSPVDGRLGEWLVSEGDVVRAGDPLVEVRDNDPDLLDRLGRQALTLVEEEDALRAQLLRYEAKVEALAASGELVGAEYASKAAEIAQERVGAVAAVETARANFERVRQLADEGIASERERELADLGLRSATAKLDALDASLSAMRQAGAKARAEVDAKRAGAEADLELSRTKRAEVERKRFALETQRTRQSAQVVVAPRDGTVLRVYGGPGGEQVKQGDALVALVPDVRDRAVELWVDGNDMPLVARDEEVRLVFEGWPALQVVGLPGASEGTFAGRVDFVDATDDGAGRFRVVVVPEEGEAPWPDGAVLRQGVRAKGWFLLGQVTLGYELWRQLNGFPPLPSIDKGDPVSLPSAKKPRAPGGLKG